VRIFPHKLKQMSRGKLDGPLSRMAEYRKRFFSVKQMGADIKEDLEKVEMSM
jgi:hypothetical protein